MAGFRFSDVRRSLVALAMLLLAGGCSTTPPNNLGNSCEIFDEKGGWYKDAKRAYERWGVPVHVQLAIVYQESKFVDDAKAPRDYVLWVIPWGRVSSAYGYAQALDGTWDLYRKEAGNRWADRDDFDDAVDFIAWYGNKSQRELGVSKWDAYNQYLAYHEGQNGYRRKTYAKKPWLLKVARTVEQRSERYQAQLAGCKHRLDRGWRLWPF